MPLILPIELKVTPAVRGLVHSDPPYPSSRNSRRRNRRSFFLSSVFLYNHYVLLTSLARTAFPSIIKSISKPGELISPGTRRRNFIMIPNGPRCSHRSFGCQAPSGVLRTMDARQWSRGRRGGFVRGCNTRGMLGDVRPTHRCLRRRVSTLQINPL